MIKTENGNIEIKGSMSGIMTDLHIVLKNVREAFIKAGETEERADELIDTVVMNSRRTMEKIKSDAIDELFDILFGGDF